MDLRRMLGAAVSGSRWTTSAEQLAMRGWIRSSQDATPGKATIANDHLYSYELLDTLHEGGDTGLYAAQDGWIQLLAGGLYGASAHVKWNTGDTNGNRYVGLIAGPDDGEDAFGQEVFWPASPAAILYKWQSFGHQSVKTMFMAPADGRLPFDIGIQVWQDSGISQVVSECEIQVTPFLLF